MCLICHIILIAVTMKDENIDLVAYDCGSMRQQQAACQPFANVGSVRILFYSSNS
jgi:hypothetical protein